MAEQSISMEKDDFEDPEKIKLWTVLVNVTGYIN